MLFADKVVKKEQPFDNMGFSGFIPLFEMIKKIIDVNNDDSCNTRTAFL